MGGLICHIENGQCEAISKAKFKQTLLENQKKEDDQERQRAFLLYGRTAGGFGTQSPATSARDEKTLSDVPFGGNVKLELASLSATNSR
jgi:hypothetical protein